MLKTSYFQPYKSFLCKFENKYPFTYVFWALVAHNWKYLSKEGTFHKHPKNSYFSFTFNHWEASQLIIFGTAYFVRPSLCFFIVFVFPSSQNFDSSLLNLRNWLLQVYFAASETLFFHESSQYLAELIEIQRSVLFFAYWKKNNRNVKENYALYGKIDLFWAFLDLRKKKFCVFFREHLEDFRLLCVG